MNDSNQFFYAYDKKLMAHLRTRGFVYNCTGMNLKTRKIFYQYNNSDTLSIAIAEFMLEKSLTK
jgi:hypothetical protein